MKVFPTNYQNMNPKISHFQRIPQVVCLNFAFLFNSIKILKVKVGSLDKSRKAYVPALT